MDAELWVVGERLASDHGAEIEPLFMASGLGPRLRRLGYREDVAALLAAADIFALPSHARGCRCRSMEAMLCGLPVVASDIPGPREQVMPEQTGVLVPVRDAARLAAALARLAGDAPLRARMGAAGRARAVALHDEARVVERMMHLLGRDHDPDHDHDHDPDYDPDHD